MSKKKMTSVEDLVRDIAPNDEFCADLRKELEASRTCRRLVALRASKGFSQSDIAERMGCTQSRISKLENSTDDKWSVEDLRAYAKAIDCRVGLSVLPLHMEPVEEVNLIAAAVERRMFSLLKLAEKDADIANGVSTFMFELFVRFGAIFGTTSKRFPRRADGTRYFECTVGMSEHEVSREEDSMENEVVCE